MTKTEAAAKIAALIAAGKDYEKSSELREAAEQTDNWGLGRFALDRLARVSVFGSPMPGEDADETAPAPANAFSGIHTPVMDPREAAAFYRGHERALTED